MTDTLTRAEVLAARGYDPPPPIEPSEPNAEAPDPPPVAEPERRCEICSTDIDHRSPLAKVCESHECKAEAQKRRDKRRRERQKAESEAQPEAMAAEPATHDDVDVDAEIVEPDDEQGPDDAEEFIDDPLDRIKDAAAAFIHACAAERDIINDARRQIIETLAEVGELLK